MAKTVNPDAVKLAAQQLLEADKRRKSLTEEYKNEEKVSIYISPQYAAYFGRNMTVSINGICISIPVDGNSYEVPKTFADEITSRRMAIDNHLRKLNRIGNVSANVERSPGELKLF